MLEVIVALITPAQWVLISAFNGATLTGVGGVETAVSAAVALALGFIAWGLLRGVRTLA